MRSSGSTGDSALARSYDQRVQLFASVISKIWPVLLLVTALALAPALTPDADADLDEVPGDSADGDKPPSEFSDPLPLDEEWDAGPISAAGQRTLDRVRNAVVQIRGFYGTSSSEAFHGSGFVVAANGLVVTNCHFVSRAATDHVNYRLEFTPTMAASAG
jgi:hypothetical protein